MYFGIFGGLWSRVGRRFGRHWRCAKRSKLQQSLILAVGSVATNVPEGWRVRASVETKIGQYPSSIQCAKVKPLESQIDHLNLWKITRWAKS